MDEKIDGWMDGWIDRYMDGWMDGWMVAYLIKLNNSACICKVHLVSLALSFIIIIITTTILNLYISLTYIYP